MLWERHHHTDKINLNYTDNPETWCSQFCCYNWNWVNTIHKIFHFSESDGNFKYLRYLFFNVKSSLPVRTTGILIISGSLTDTHKRPTDPIFLNVGFFSEILTKYIMLTPLSREWEPYSPQHWKFWICYYPLHYIYYITLKYQCNVTYEWLQVCRMP